MKNMISDAALIDFINMYLSISLKNSDIKVTAKIKKDV